MNAMTPTMGQRKTKRTFWCVQNYVYEDGEQETSMFGREHNEKPKDTSMRKPGKDLTKKWFDTKEEAESYHERINPRKTAALQDEHPIRRLRMITPGDLAKILGVSEKKAYDMATKRDIPPCQIRGNIRFHPSDVEDYIFFSRFAPSPMQIRPSDKEELFQRLDERNEQVKACLEGLFSRNESQKRRPPCR